MLMSFSIRGRAGIAVRAADFFSLLVAATAGGCAGTSSSLPVTAAATRRAVGSDFVLARVHQGIPIHGDSMFWHGEGDIAESGLGVQFGRQLTERVAVGAGTNLSGWWTSGSDIYSAEIEALGRVRPVADWPVFVDGTLGYLYATDRIPEGGTAWNLSFGFGGGIELPLDDCTSLMLGGQYHHISNGKGSGDSNPTENEGRFWIGVCWWF
jgi:hypothetical protein